MKSRRRALDINAVDLFYVLEEESWKASAVNSDE